MGVRDSSSCAGSTAPLFLHSNGEECVCVFVHVLIANAISDLSPCFRASSSCSAVVLLLLMAAHLSVFVNYNMTINALCVMFNIYIVIYDSTGRPIIMGAKAPITKCNTPNITMAQCRFMNVAIQQSQNAPVLYSLRCMHSVEVRVPLSHRDDD